MAIDRVISGEGKPADPAVDHALRPKRLAEMVGQSNLREKLTIAMAAARKRHEPLEHILLDGPPGLGKTTLAHVIATEMNAKPPRITAGPSLAKQGDLMPLLTAMEEGDILFIDEIHRLPRIVEEFLYPALEDFRVDFTIEGGLSGRVVNFALRRFTVIGATTRAGMLSAAMRDRFGHHFHFEFYSVEELTDILRRSAAKLNIAAKPDALETIAGRSRGTPRVANRLLKRARDYAQVKGDGTLDRAVVLDALDIQRIDPSGLDDLDRAYLAALIKVYEGGPAGIEAIAATMSQERDTLEDVVEPYLLQIAFIRRTRQGREATPAACAHLGLPYTPATTPTGSPEPSLF